MRMNILTNKINPSTTYLKKLFQLMNENNVESLICDGITINMRDQPQEIVIETPVVELEATEMIEEESIDRPPTTSAELDDYLHTMMSN